MSKSHFTQLENACFVNLIESNTIRSFTVFLENMECLSNIERQQLWMFRRRWIITYSWKRNTFVESFSD